MYVIKECLPRRLFIAVFVEQISQNLLALALITMKFQVVFVTLVVYVIGIYGYVSRFRQNRPVVFLSQTTQNINRFNKQIGFMDFSNFAQKRDPSNPISFIRTNKLDLQTQVKPTVIEDFSYDYETHNGPSHWGRFNAICETGNRQSPVNLIEKEAFHKSSQKPLFIEGFATQPTSMKIENNGHSAKFTFNHLNNKPIQFLGGPLKTAYNLDGIHFHWGPNDFFGSEHVIDYHRQSAEVHFVTWNSIYKNLADATNKPNGLAVLGVLYQLNNEPSRREEDNPFIKFLSLVQEPGSSHTMYDNLFSIRDLIKSLDFEYLSYKGSLTTPPCTETVTWLVSVKLLNISSYELAQFRKIKDFGGHPIKTNFRALHKINYQRVLAY